MSVNHVGDTDNTRVPRYASLAWESGCLGDASPKPQPLNPNEERSEDGSKYQGHLQNCKGQGTGAKGPGEPVTSLNPES